MRNVAIVLGIVILSLVALGFGMGHLGKTSVRRDEAPQFVEEGLKKLQITTLRGDKGESGTACWDTNGDGVKDDAEDINSDGVWDAQDCQGAAGIDGLNGVDGKDGKDGKDGWCFGGCCGSACAHPVVIVMPPEPAPAPKTGLIFNQSFDAHPATGAKVTITVNGTPVPAR